MPRQDPRIKETDGGVVIKLRQKLKAPQGLMDQIGFLMLEASQFAFEEERFGDFKWPQQYGEREPFIHVAGALSDLNEEGEIKDQRFKRGRPLRDSGLLHDTLNPKSTRGKKAGTFTVTVGSSAPYANLHQQEGSVSEQEITETALESLAEILSKARKRKSKKSEALKTLGFLFNVDTLETNVQQRPFVGITDELEEDIRETVEEFFEDRQ